MMDGPESLYLPFPVFDIDKYYIEKAIEILHKKYNFNKDKVQQIIKNRQELKSRLRQLGEKGLFYRVFHRKEYSTLLEECKQELEQLIG